MVCMRTTTELNKIKKLTKVVIHQLYMALIFVFVFESATKNTFDPPHVFVVE